MGVDDDEESDYRRRWAVEQSITLHKTGAKVERILTDARQLERYAAGRRKAKIFLINKRKEKP